MKLTVYTIGAITGLSYDECFNQFDTRVKKLKSMGFDVIYPILGEGKSRNVVELEWDKQPTDSIDSNHTIVKSDFWRVDNADILFADFTNSPNRISIGSVAEISRGYAKDKLIITVMQKNNIHRHAFIQEMSTIIFETTDEAYDYLSNIARK